MIPQGWASERPTGTALRRAIEQHLTVKFIEWNEVDAYVTGLEAILGGIRVLARQKPTAAHQLALHFLRRIPTIFESVHDETELADFCDELSEAAIELGLKAKIPALRTVEVLLRLYAEDDYGRFGQVPDLLAASRFSSGDRAQCAQLADRLAAEPGTEVTRRGLLQVAQALRPLPASRRSRKPIKPPIRTLSAK